MILDEPTNGLDPAGIREIRDHLKKLAREKGMAIIVSSHLLSEMEMMCDRIAIIQDGKLIDIQPVNEKGGSGQKHKYYIELAGRLSKLPDNLSYETVFGGIEMEMSREEVPAMIKLFVENGLHIFEVKPVTKTLEDRFLEITGKGGN
jgi:ABC-2 type transport system ATP-binding protein